GREVKYAGDTLARTVASIEVGDIRLDEFGAARDPTGLAIYQVVHDPDSITALEEALRQMTADETRATRDQHQFGHLLFRFSVRPLLRNYRLEEGQVLG